MIEIGLNPINNKNGYIKFILTLQQNMCILYLTISLSTTNNKNNKHLKVFYIHKHKRFFPFKEKKKKKKKEDQKFFLQFTNDFEIFAAFIW